MAFNASIDDATEIGMGAPTCGELSISNGLVIPDFSLLPNGNRTTTANINAL